MTRFTNLSGTCACHVQLALRFYPVQGGHTPSVLQRIEASSTVVLVTLQLS